MCVFNNTFDHFGTINNFKLMSDQITREPDVYVKIVKESKTDIKYVLYQSSGKISLFVSKVIMETNSLGILIISI